MTDDLIKNKFAKLLATIEKKYSADDIELVRLAFDFADEAHRGQTRASGEPYVLHPLATAQKLAELNLDPVMIIAGLLHDVPEDTPLTLEDIRKNFGAEVAKLVEGITKLGKIKYRGMDRYAENLRKMFISMSEDIRVIFIKFADRLHNLQTLRYLPPEKQHRIALETLEIYAPIADRLSMGLIKGELEDLAFASLYPEDYKWLTEILPQERRGKEKLLENVKEIVSQKLKENNITLENISIQGRTKHLYSLYKKLLRPNINRDLSKIYDLTALRLIVPNVADCYSVLGIIHNLYRPVPGQIKDYIAQPKPNGYRCLHTTVFTDEGEIVEFQIRTREMHEEAEFGVAAHWNYKETGGKVNRQQLKWLDELVKWQKQIKDNDQFIQTVRFDVFRNRIFVLTPKGDVIDLPERATPIDFAYHVHSSLGNKCVGAKVNDQLVSLAQQLKSGDVVEIVIDKNRKAPNPDWLELAKTPMARSKIRNAINKIKNTERAKLESRK